jgi:hypothetical protein
MTRVKCRRRDCVHWEEGVCGRDLITIDEDEGCVNFEEISDLLEDDEELDWDAEENEEELDFFEEDEEWEEDEEEEDEEEGPLSARRTDWDER